MAEGASGDSILKRNGCKSTKAREAVLRILEGTDTPVSADEIYIKLREEGAAANLSTVYRTLEFMEKKGLVEKSALGDGRSRFELVNEEHRHHLVCTRCHKTVSIADCPLKALEKAVGKKTSFDITGHKLEIYGLCPKCKQE